MKTLVALFVFLGGIGAISSPQPLVVAVGLVLIGAGSVAGLRQIARTSAGCGEGSRPGVPSPGAGSGAISFNERTAHLVSASPGAEAQRRDGPGSDRLPAAPQASRGAGHIHAGERS